MCRGMDFGDHETVAGNEGDWSLQKVRHEGERWSTCLTLTSTADQKLNVEGLQTLVAEINRQCEDRAVIGNIESAIAGASKPAVTPIKTTTKFVKLTIGDMDEFPSESVSFEVEVQKAVQKAGSKSMQQMRKGAWNKRPHSDKDSGVSAGRKKRRDDDIEGNDEEEDMDKQDFSGPGSIAADRVYKVRLLFPYRLNTLPNSYGIITQNASLQKKRRESKMTTNQMKRTLRRNRDARKLQDAWIVKITFPKLTSTVQICCLFLRKRKRVSINFQLASLAFK